MSILKYKYKAHKFINYIFYVVVFIVGFLLGFASNKINYNKLISQILMIDNVYAATLSGEYVTIDNIEEYMLNNIPIEWKDSFNIEEYPYAIINSTTSKNATIDVIFLKSLDNLQISITSLFFHLDTTGTDIAYYRIYEDGGYVNTGGFRDSYSGSLRMGDRYKNTILLYDLFLTNFDITTIPITSNETEHTIEEFSKVNKLDFSGFGNLEFNENLFKDNPDFKEVCVNETDKFLITPVDYGENNEISTADFIWFPYKISGFYGSSIDNDNIIGKNTSNEYRFYFNSKEAINSEFTEDGLQYLLFIISYYSYENRYSYYGWSAHPFNLFYNQNNDNYYSFPYFYFENPEMYKLDGSKIENNESLPFDDYLSYNNEKICFYIRSKFNVEIINKDLNDNDYIDLPLPGGNIHINGDNSNFSSGLFTSITKFINEVSECLDLIKINIYNFYSSMPYLLRLFIVAVLTVLIVKFIIGMVVK